MILFSLNPDHRWKRYSARFIAASIMSLGFQAYAAAGVSLSIEGKDMINLGVFMDNQSPAAEFTVVNSGDQALKIVQILKTCGCNSAKAEKDSLKPGEKTKISVGIEPYTLDGPFSKKVYVITEPPLPKQFSLTVTGESIPLFKIRPSKQINAGKLKNGAEWNGTFDISAKNPVEFGKPAVTSDCPASVELKLIGESSWILPVSLTAPTNSRFKCSVTIPIVKPEGRPPLVFQIFGRAGTELVAIPRMVVIPEAEAFSKTVQLRIIGKRGRKLKPEELSISPDVDGLVFTAEPERNGGLRLKLEISKELAEGVNEGDVVELDLSVPDAAPVSITLKPVFQGSKHETKQP